MHLLSDPSLASVYSNLSLYNYNTLVIPTTDPLYTGGIATTAVEGGGMGGGGAYGQSLLVTIQGIAQPSYTRGREKGGAVGGGGGGAGGGVGISVSPLAVHIIQQPLYDMLRLIFSR